MSISTLSHAKSIYQTIFEYFKNTKLRGRCGTFWSLRMTFAWIHFFSSWDSKIDISIKTHPRVLVRLLPILYLYDYNKFGKLINCRLTIKVQSTAWLDGLAAVRVEVVGSHRLVEAVEAATGVDAVDDLGVSGVEPVLG